MKFLLTIYTYVLLATGECVSPKLEQFKIKQFYGTHYGCVRAGLGDSFEILFDGKTFPVQDQLKDGALSESFLARKFRASSKAESRRNLPGNQLIPLIPDAWILSLVIFNR